MNTTGLHRKDRRKGCYAVAMHRACMARRQGRSRLVVLLILLWAILSGPFPSPRPPSRAQGKEWPITDYERGLGGDLLLRPRPATSRTGRYRSRPSFAKLMADLRRPAVRKDAALVLLARITDPVARAWVAERIAKGEINRLSIWTRLGRSEETIMAAWRGEADAALAEAASGADAATPDRGSLLEAARLLEALATTETHATEASKIQRAS